MKAHNDKTNAEEKAKADAIRESRWAEFQIRMDKEEIKEETLTMKGESMAYKFTDEQKVASIDAQLEAIRRINDMFAAHVDPSIKQILAPAGLAGKCGFSENGGLELVITDLEDRTCEVTLSLDGAKNV